MIIARSIFVFYLPLFVLGCGMMGPPGLYLSPSPQEALADKPVPTYHVNELGDEVWIHHPAGGRPDWDQFGLKINGSETIWLYRRGVDASPWLGHHYPGNQARASLMSQFAGTPRLVDNLSNPENLVSLVDTDGDGLFDEVSATYGNYELRYIAIRKDDTP